MIATPFTPIASLFGGALIGLSAVLLMWTKGRIAGVSGIAARLFPPYEDRELPAGSPSSRASSPRPCWFASSPEACRRKRSPRQRRC